MKKHLRVVFGACAAVVVAVAAAIATPPAHAGLLSCGSTTHPFTRWDDNNPYYAFQNNDFELGSAGWALSGGARVVSGNDPYFIDGPGSYSLYLPSGSSALSPKVCVNLFSPYARMMAIDESGTDRGLNAQVIYYGLLGNVLGIFNFATFSPADHREWLPSDPAPAALNVPVLVAYARIKLTPSGFGSDWQVDDAFVDPWVNVVG